MNNISDGLSAFWAKMDKTILNLAQTAFEQCWSELELKECGNKVKFIFDTMYREHESKAKTRNQLSELYKNRLNYLESLTPGFLKEPGITGFNGKA